MPTPFITDPYRVLASYALGLPEEHLQGRDILEVQHRVERAITTSQSPGCLLFNFLRGLDILRGDPTQAEKLLRFFLRRDGDQQVSPGAYRHFKGGLYTVERIALLLQGSSEQQAVIYFGLEDPTKVFVRPLIEWSHIVQWPDGEYRLRFMRQPSSGV